MRVYRAAVVYHFVPHYREGFVRELDSRAEMDVTWFCSDTGVEGIRALIPSAFKKVVFVRNLWLKSILVQPYIIMLSLRGKFDAVVFLASPYFLSTWVAALILRIRGVRVVFWGHGPQKGKRKLSWLERMFYCISDACYLYGYHGRSNLVALGLSPSMLYVGLNSLKLPDTFPDKTLRSSDADGSILTVVALSRLIPACKYDQLLEAAAICRERYGIVCRLVFIGDGECLLDLKNQSDRLGLNVTFMGAIYDESIISSVLLSSHCLAQPGKVGLSAMHALSYGLPVITHGDFDQQMPEVEAIVPFVTGLLHRVDDVDDLAYKLSQFLLIFPDRGVVHDNCLKVVREFYNPEYQVDVFEDCVVGRVPDSRGSFGELFSGAEK